MTAEIYCNYDGSLDVPNPYTQGYRRNYDDSSGPVCYDPVISYFPLEFIKYSEWCIENGIYMSLADETPFINDDGDKKIFPILQFDSTEYATAFKLRWL